MMPIGYKIDAGFAAKLDKLLIFNGIPHEKTNDAFYLQNRKQFLSCFESFLEVVSIPEISTYVIFDCAAICSGAMPSPPHVDQRYQFYKSNNLVETVHLQTALGLEFTKQSEFSGVWMGKELWVCCGVMIEDDTALSFVVFQDRETPPKMDSVSPMVLASLSTLGYERFDPLTKTFL
jgi:hypothetical protein